jgi:predicted dehydrogenase
MNENIVKNLATKERMLASINVGVVGLGYWGPNLVRSLSRIPQVTMKYGCDLDETKRAKIASLYPSTHVTADFEELLSDDHLSAVVVASSASTHAALAKQALLAGKDVLVEKPLTLSVADAQLLVKLAAEKDRILMVGHLLEYHPGIVRLRQMIESGELGEIFYVYTHRLNLGTIRRDENALWSLAPHDLSVIMYLLGEEPTEVQATGHAYLNSRVEDIVFATLRFADGRMGHLHVSWLDPHRERKITVVGSQKMAVFDDTSRDEKLKVYDKGVQNFQYDSYGEYINLRFGNICIPYIPNDEPLKLECEHFIECLMERKQPISSGYSGLRVVRVLDALQRSLDTGGHPISLDTATTVSS